MNNERSPAQKKKNLGGKKVLEESNKSTSLGLKGGVRKRETR